MTLKKTLALTLLSTPLLLTGCSDDKATTEAPKATATAPASQTAPAADPHAGLNVPLQLASNQGRVLNSQTAGGYTYAEVEQNGRTFWIAGPQSEVKQGDIVSWGQASIMRNFTSKSLSRTFDEIYFVASYEPVRDVGGLRSNAPVANGTQGKVLSVQNAGGYSYLEVETSQGTKWVAAPQASVKQGDTVSWQGASLMRNFTSSSLGKTFNEIFFAGSVSKIN